MDLSTEYFINIFFMKYKWWLSCSYRFASTFSTPAIELLLYRNRQIFFSIRSIKYTHLIPNTLSLDVKCRDWKLLNFNLNRYFRNFNCRQHAIQEQLQDEGRRARQGKSAGGIHFNFTINFYCKYITRNCLTLEMKVKSDRIHHPQWRHWWQNSKYKNQNFCASFHYFWDISISIVWPW